MLNPTAASLSPACGQMVQAPTFTLAEGLAEKPVITPISVKVAGNYKDPGYDFISVSVPQELQIPTRSSLLLSSLGDHPLMGGL